MIKDINNTLELYSKKIQFKALAILGVPNAQVTTSISHTKEALTVQFEIIIGAYCNVSKVALQTKSERQNPEKHINKLIDLIAQDMHNKKIK